MLGVLYIFLTFFFKKKTKKNHGLSWSCVRQTYKLQTNFHIKKVVKYPTRILPELVDG